MGGLPGARERLEAAGPCAQGGLGPVRDHRRARGWSPSGRTPPTSGAGPSTQSAPERDRTQNADAQAIKQAYRALSLKWHPDKNKGNEVEAEKRFVEITKAYEACVIRTVCDLAPGLQLLTKKYTACMSPRTGSRTRRPWPTLKSLVTPTAVAVRL